MKRSLQNSLTSIYCLLAACIFLSLLSYHPTDPGWTFIGQFTAPIKNFGGLIGAWLADVLFSLFGYLAYILPFFFIDFAIRQYQAKKSDVLIVWSGIVLLFFSGSTLCSLHVANVQHIPISSGGLFGAVTAHTLLSILSPEFISVLALTGTITGVITMRYIQWIGLCDTLGNMVWKLFARLIPSQHPVSDNGYIDEEPLEEQTRKKTTTTTTTEKKPISQYFTYFLQAFTSTKGKRSSVSQRIEPHLGDEFLHDEQAFTQDDQDMSEGDNETTENQNAYIATYIQSYRENFGDLPEGIDPKILEANMPLIHTSIDDTQLHNKYETDHTAIPDQQPMDSEESKESTEASQSYAQPTSTTPMDLNHSIPIENTETDTPIYTPIIGTNTAQNNVDTTIETSATMTDDISQNTPPQEIHQPIPIMMSGQIITENTHTVTKQPSNAPPLANTNDEDISKDSSTQVFDYPFQSNDIENTPAEQEQEQEHSTKKNTENQPTENHSQPTTSANKVDNAFSQDEMAYFSHNTEQPDPATKPTIRPVSNAKPLPPAPPAKKHIDYSLPSTDLLTSTPEEEKVHISPEILQKKGQLLEQRLNDYNVKAKVVAINPGPVITRFEVQPAPGVKVIRIANLAKDLARSLTVTSVRVVEVIPGKSTVGIEIPNEKRQMVQLGDVLNSTEYFNSTQLPLALGDDIEGKPVITNLAKMPHLLVAGTTGSGKSVGVNAMLISLLFKLNPQEVRLILIDPKMLELSVYNGIPHLLTPVITDMKDAANGLRWCVAEMERRYRLMSKLGVRNLEGYNNKVQQSQDGIADPLYTGDPEGAPLLKALPFLVVVIDEFADMMMIVGKKVEELIARIAQKARAAGIHLILATQRPSVDVITGLIKANIPTRIAFQVSSKIDSRTILDQTGADQLLGHGDMLYQPPGSSVPLRVHGAFVADEEVHRVVAFWQEQDGPEYIDSITQSEEEKTSSEKGENDDPADELYGSAVEFVIETQRVSISYVQRKLKIGYNRAARIIETMEEQGIVSAMESNGKREVLITAPPSE